MTKLSITEAGAGQVPTVRHAAEIGWMPLSSQATPARRGWHADSLTGGRCMHRFNPWMTNDSAVKALGDATLPDIVRQLVDTARDNVTID